MSAGSRPRPLLKPPTAEAPARRVTAFLGAALAALALALLLAGWGEARLRRDLDRLRAATALRDDLAASGLAMEGVAQSAAGAAPTAAEVWPPLERALRQAAILAAAEPPANDPKSAPAASPGSGPGSAPGSVSASEAVRLHRELQRFAEATLALQADREAGLLRSPSAGAYDAAYAWLAGASARMVDATGREAGDGRRLFRLGAGSAAGLALLFALVALLSFRRFAGERRRAETELRERDAQLVQAQKMEAVGRLAGGIAHDINNYLGAIRLNCDLVAKRPLPREETVERMRGALAAIRRASTLISRLLAFGRRQPAQPEVVPLNGVVEGLRKILRQHLGERIELSLRLAPDLWAIKIDPAQVEQILVNLLVNAREAMPSGGSLTVETANVSLPDPPPGSPAGPARAPSPVSAPGDYVLLTVTDTGIGMPPEVLDKIFEPFFTTKEGGSGLGLATVYGIVKQNGGNVWAESRPKGGTTFRIYLPRCLEKAPEAALRETAIRPLAPSGGETILLVEDGEEMREATRALLLSAGYRVTAAAGGVEALESLETAPPIDLLLTDVVMRGMSGPEVAEQVQAFCGPLPVVFVSGYTESAVGLHGLPLAQAHFLAKPYAADALLEKIREALAQGAAAPPP